MEIEDATNEDMVSALVKETETFRRDFQTFCYGYKAALGDLESHGEDVNADDVTDEIIQAYIGVLAHRRKDGSLQKMLEKAEGEM